jgi:uncharacterized membrane protein HdeD (DUF308 family)
MEAANIEVRAATGGWWLVLLAGVISIAVGVALLLKPGDSLETLAVIAGIFVLVDGLIELAASLFHGTQSRGMVALLGVLSVIVGVLLIRHPISGITAIALLIAIWLIAAGVVRIVAAFEVDGPRGWGIFAGLVAMAAGTVIIVDPSIGYTTLALLAGIAFIAHGIGLSALGWGMRELRHEAAAP